MIAGLVWCAERLDQPELLDDATRFALSARSALRVAPTVPDLMDGTAGLLLGLSVLQRKRPAAAILAAMRICGEDILRRSSLSGEKREWQDRGRPGLTGLSHGAGGIAVALAHLASLDKKQGPWRDAVRQSLAYEDRWFDPERGNWRTPGNNHIPFKATWCHGAPGIALARQAIGELLPELAADQAAPIDHAIATTRRSPIEDVDDLCCGEAGRLDILMTLAARRHDPELAAEAGTGLTGRLPDWVSGGAKLMAVQAGAPDDPSLLRGLGGLVHLIVRHIAPQHAAGVLMPFADPAVR